MAQGQGNRRQPPQVGPNLMGVLSQLGGGGGPAPPGMGGGMAGAGASMPGGAGPSHFPFPGPQAPMPGTGNSSPLVQGGMRNLLPVLANGMQGGSRGVENSMGQSGSIGIPNPPSSPLQNAISRRLSSKGVGIGEKKISKAAKRRKMNGRSARY